mgnify:FL=1
MVTLRENEVPTCRAVWYVKMCAAYSNAMTEVKTNKKRQVSDPSQEWTHALTRFLKDQLQEILSSSSDDSTKNENSTAHKNWIYTLKMCEYMYNQGLLDRQEFLQWVLEMVEKCKYPDDPLMRMVLPILVSFFPSLCFDLAKFRLFCYCFDAKSRLRFLKLPLGAVLCLIHSKMKF